MNPEISVTAPGTNLSERPSLTPHLLLLLPPAPAPGQAYQAGSPATVETHTQQSAVHVDDVELCIAVAELSALLMFLTQHDEDHKNTKLYLEYHIFGGC